jgi:hypothetical protein
MFENRVLRRIVGPQREDELHMYSYVLFANIIREIEPRRIK